MAKYHVSKKGDDFVVELAQERKPQLVFRWVEAPVREEKGSLHVVLHLPDTLEAVAEETVLKDVVKHGITFVFCLGGNPYLVVCAATLVSATKMTLPVQLMGNESLFVRDDRLDATYTMEWRHEKP